MVCAINPSLDLHTDSTELLQLQQVCLQIWFVLNFHYIILCFLPYIGCFISVLCTVNCHNIGIYIMYTCIFMYLLSLRSYFNAFFFFLVEAVMAAIWSRGFGEVWNVSNRSDKFRAGMWLIWTDYCIEPFWMFVLLYWVYWRYPMAMGTLADLEDQEPMTGKESPLSIHLKVYDFSIIRDIYKVVFINVH